MPNKISVINDLFDIKIIFSKVLFNRFIELHLLEVKFRQKCFDNNFLRSEK